MLKINIGAGKTNLGDDWINIDKIKSKNIHSDDIELYGYDDNSVDLIYSSHFIEYFDRVEIRQLLTRWRKKLKKHGELRLAVPNFTTLAYIVLNLNQPIETILGPIYGRIPNSDYPILSDEKFIYHKTCYTFDSLKRLLESIGFKKIQWWDWENVKPHDKIDDCSASFWPHRQKNIKKRKFDSDQIHVSLNLRAFK